MERKEIAPKEESDETSRLTLMWITEGQQLVIVIAPSSL